VSSLNQLHTLSKSVHILFHAAVAAASNTTIEVLVLLASTGQGISHPSFCCYCRLATPPKIIVSRF
jgi:hypothetical protein